MTTHHRVLSQGVHAVAVDDEDRLSTRDCETRPMSLRDVAAEALDVSVYRGGMDIAASEYGYKLDYLEKMLAAGAVTCLQADVTRCEGMAGFLCVATLCQARSLELSAHCGPSIYAHTCCAVVPVRHLEYFHDHARLEPMLFDGALEPDDGALHPDFSRPGNGLEFKRADAERYAV